MMTPKVFCIGFHKTGTTSLAVALKELGYRVTGPNGVWDANIGRNVHKMAAAVAKKYDAFRDNPWPMLYREMDRQFPDSKFVLTIRDPESWIRSQVRHFGSDETPMRKWIYGVGCPEGNEAVYVARMEQHNQEVLDYFGDRRDDFLVLDLARGDGWEELCPFLGQAIPDMPFPHSNKASERERSDLPGMKLLSAVKQFVGRLQ